MTLLKKIGTLAVIFMIPAVAQAQLINEWEPNPAGGDPAMQPIELLGTPDASFDLWVLSIENDGFNGIVDEGVNVTGTYDSNGIASVMIDDFENPSNTLVLTDSFTGTVDTTDIDPADDGTLDLSTIGTIFDAVAISDNAGDDASLYGSLLGGSDILFNGEFEPLLIFREETTGDWYQTVTVDFGGPDEHIGVFAAAGGLELDAAGFSPDPTVPTFGAANPALVPEPSTMGMLLLGLLSIAFIRKR